MISFPYQKIGYFLILLMMQLLIFQNNALFGLAFGFVYIGCLIMWPLEANRSLLMTFGFFLGLFVDIFSNTLGIHMFACVLTAFLRTYLVEYLTPTGGYDKNSEISLNNMGISWFLSYVSIAVFFHLSVLYFVDTLSFQNFGWALLKIFASTLLTVFVIVLLEFFDKKRKSSF